MARRLKREEVMTIEVLHERGVAKRAIARQLGLDPERVRARGLFDAAEVSRLMDVHVAGRENHAHTLFPLMVFERWAAEHLR